MEIKKLIKYYIKTLKYVFRLSKFYVISNILLVLFKSFLNTFSIMMIKWIFDAITNRMDFKYLILLLVLNFSLNMIYSVTNTILSTRTYPKYQQLLKYNLNKDIYEEVFKKNLNATETSSYYDNFYFALDKGENSIAAVFNLSLNLLGSLTTFIGIISVLVNYSFFIIMLIILNAVITFLINIKVSKTTHDYNYSLVKESRESSYIERLFYLQEYAKEIKLYNMLTLLLSKLGEVNKNIIDKINYYGKKLAYLNISQSFTLSLFDAVIIAYLGYNIVYGTIIVSDFMMLYNGAKSLLNQINSLMLYIPSLYENILYTAHFFDFFETKKIDSSKTDNIASLDRITLRNINFRYKETSSFQLQNINIELEKGQKIAIIGNNGSGKSTLLKIICGLYAPDNGDIYINGLNINNIDIQSFWNKTFMLFQDYQLYSFSIYENIMLQKNSQKSSDIKKVKEALKFVDLYDKINGLPKGIDSVLSNEFNDEGINLSGGESQRIAIARAYVRNFDVFIFDEPTSSLDQRSSLEINQLIDKLAENKIMLYTTHKIVNMKRFDKIILMDDGQIINCGTHDELMKSSPIYQKMYLKSLKNQ